MRLRKIPYTSSCLDVKVNFEDQPIFKGKVKLKDLPKLWTDLGTKLK